MIANHANRSFTAPAGKRPVKRRIPSAVLALTPQSSKPGSSEGSIQLRCRLLQSRLKILPVAMDSIHVARNDRRDRDTRVGEKNFVTNFLQSRHRSRAQYGIPVAGGYRTTDRIRWLYQSIRLMVMRTIAPASLTLPLRIIAAFKWLAVSRMSQRRSPPRSLSDGRQAGSRPSASQSATLHPGLPHGSNAPVARAGAALAGGQSDRPAG